MEVSQVLSWQSFEVFYADMGERPEGKSIDRRNNAGNYTPSNCRWATQREQRANKRKVNYHFSRD